MEDPQKAADQQIQAVIEAKKPKHPGGRPTIVTDDVIVKLIAAFQNGMDTLTACHYARISKDAFYDRLAKDQEFADTIQDAKHFLQIRSGKRVVEIIDKGDERVAGPLAWKVLEKRIPAMYGPMPPTKGDKNSNNLFILNNGQISFITKQPDIATGSPAELLENLEATSKVDIRAEEGSITPIHQEEIQSINPQESSVPQPSATV